MKIRYADFRELTSVNKSISKLSYINDESFKGYIFFYKILDICEPSIECIIDYSFCNADANYIYLRYFPDEEDSCYIVVFDNNLKFVECYIDITSGTQFTKTGLPYYEDMYLDIEILSTGEVLYLDEDELDDALINKAIDKDSYNKAKNTAFMLLNKIINNEFKVENNYYKHLDYFLALIEEN